MLEKPRRRREAAKAAFEHGKRAPEKETDKEREIKEELRAFTERRAQENEPPTLRTAPSLSLASGGCQGLPVYRRYLVCGHTYANIVLIREIRLYLGKHTQ
jgi:hypothetical protein